MKGLYIQYLAKIPHYPVPRVLESLQHPKEQTEISPPLNNNTKALLLLQKRHLHLFGEAGLNYKVGLGNTNQIKHQRTVHNCYAI